ncbi:PREDICTED: POU domain, class 5, transcription factor 2 [Chinchilla lanigera]|uniref:POU domain, class 5, transcription factor 2 n=1 Tax=Chinchilla lanigera TaxID=34839 RepID=UPI00038F193D|nr:PREDICTED: POU domain, class 5, transcription factor 2 [Chinchilla lanigera]
MAGHRPPNLHPPPDSGRGGSSGPGPMPLWVDIPSWLSVQVAPGRMMVWPGIGPTICRSPEVWGVPLGTPPYEFLGGVGPSRAGQAEPWLPGPSEPTGLKPYIALLSTPKLALPEDVSAIEKEMAQLAKELRQKRLTLGYSQADVGVAVGAMFGEVLSQTTICRFESQQLSLAKMWKVGPLLKMWLAEMNVKNHQGLWKMEMILQQGRKRRQAHRETRLRNDLERLFLQCPRPTPQQISGIAGHLRLRKELVRMWFCLRNQSCGPGTPRAPRQEMAAAAGLPSPGPPVCFPLAPGLHFDLLHYGVPYLTPLYRSTPFPGGEVLLSAPAASLGLPRLSS